MDDTLFHVRYPFADGDGATGSRSRRCGPATILADVAVAVHPDDERYRDAVGREVVVPVVERRVPVIADERVEPEFGTGALKITPGPRPDRLRDRPRPRARDAHGDRPDGRMIAEGFEGLDQKEADERIVAWLEERGPARGAGAVPALGRHVRALPLPDRAARLAAVVVRDGRARAPGDRGASRAARPLPPGEPAPVRDRVAREGAGLVRLAPALVGASDPDLDVPRRAPDVRVAASRRHAPSAASAELERDPDVLDTWFSSALWPFATLGWPEQTPELERYYPGDVNSTAREIIRLWENRMIFSGLFLLGEIPFTDVIIHSTVLAPDGRRMSKSLGTGIDPMEAVESHGADATRYGLLKMSSTQDVRYSPQAIEEGRKLAIKLWNVARLILQNTEGVTPARASRGARGALDPGADRRRARRGRGRLGAVRLRRRDRASSTTSPSTTSATGTRRRSSRGSTTATRTRARPRWRRSSACSRSSTRSCRT